MIYMADSIGYSMVVYSVAQQKSWQVLNPLFRNDPKYTVFTVAGESFNFTTGILGITASRRVAINPFGAQNEKYLYFHSLSGGTENAVPLSVLNDGNSFSRNPNAHADKFRVLGDRLVSISVTLDFFVNCSFSNNFTEAFKAQLKQ